MSDGKGGKNSDSAVLNNIAASERKRQVVWGLARAMTNAEIAREIGIGERTVKSHITQMSLAFGGVPRREIPKAWFALTGENPYPTEGELEVEAM